MQFSTTFQLTWSRISFSRLTLLYFFFSIAHFVIQIALQIEVYTINADAHKILSRIVTEAQTFNSSVPFLSGDHLHLCSWIPSNLNASVSSCPVIWTSSAGDSSQNAASSLSAENVTSSRAAGVYAQSTIKPTSTSVSAVPTLVNTTASLVSKQNATTSAPSIARQTVTVLVVPQPSATANSSVVRITTGADLEEHEDHRRRNFRRDIQVTSSHDGGSLSVTVTGLKGQGSVVLEEKCLWALNWPLSIFHNTEREDLVFMAFQVWVLGMSIVALMNESIPHILASLMTHMMATAWSGFQISHTASFRSNFNRVITNGACNGVVLLPGYWDARRLAEIPSLALNAVALFVSCGLTWKLIKLFGWQTFKRVGASLTINRVYKLVLFLSMIIQLALFFMAVTVALWIDQLMNSVIGDKAEFLQLYKGTSFTTLILLLPWMITGWLAIRRELRIPMFIFLFLSFLYLGAWSIMFLSTTFRWTFVTWRFFSVMAVASVFMSLLSFLLGVVCRYNFGKGLTRHLNAQQPLPEDDKSTYGGDDLEKVAFPSGGPLPTYASFDESPYGARNGSGSTLGPRFSNPDAEPFETSATMVAFPAAIVTRNGGNLDRSNSNGSSMSSSSMDSKISKSSKHSRAPSQKARWVIE